MKMNEIWKDVVGFEGLYQVSNLGNVKSLDRLVTYSDGRQITHKGKEIIPLDNHGYLRVSLSKNGEKKEYRVHRLVALAFIPNPDNKPYVNHLDEVKSNNFVDNLEWSTKDENFNYSKEKYLEGMQKKYKKVTVTTDKGETIVYDSIKNCCKDTGIADSTILRRNGSPMIRGKYKGWCFVIG